jgi:small subunit ribosomal protein S7
MRGKQAPKRVIRPDAKYNSQTVAKLINYVMRDGKKSIAQKIVYGALEKVSDVAKKDPIEVFEEALKNVMPQVEVKPRRVGGATYQVPIEVRPERRKALGIRWMITFARRRNGRSMVDKLSGELLDAANKQGGAVRRREEGFKMAEANKAFSHYRF